MWLIAGVLVLVVLSFARWARRDYKLRATTSQMRAWLEYRGFVIEADRTLTSAEGPIGGIILARRS